MSHCFSVTRYPLISPRRPILVAVLGTLLPITAFAQAASTPAATPASDRAASQETLQLSTFTVTETQDLGYESMHTTSGMRTVQELKNVANSISIMNSQLIEDVGAIDMAEMSKWFVTGEANPDPTITERGIFRGIVNNYAVRNGWIWYSPVDAYATERVELLRGPNAFLYGEADLGGASNQITKRGRFTKNTTRAKLMVGSDDLLRGEIDINRILVKDKLAVRVAGVQSKNGSWIDHVRREFRGIYAAATYRPFPKTTISLMAEKAKNTPIVSEGLFLDQFSRTATPNVPASGGYVYIPTTGALFRSQGTGRRNSTGTGSTIVDPAIVPKTWQSNGPNATTKTNYETFTIEAEHHIGDRLHLHLSGNWYANKRDYYTAVGRNVYRDINPTLPNGQPNPYFGELYTEYFRARQIHGGQVRDMRLSAVYDLETKWMKQQITLNLQQHQDIPGHWKPTWGEYLSPSNPAFVGTIIPEPKTRADHVANRTTFTNNRFMRRFYFKDGSGGDLTGDLGPVPGVSAWYPDLGNAVPAGGEQTFRRFYTPSVGVGAAGSYFNNHLFTLVGFRRDHFNMKTRFGSPRPIENTWQVDEIADLNANSPFVQYKVDGANLGAVFRLNDSLAFAYNRAQSFRISVGDGADTYRGQKQGIPTGEGEDMSVRLSLFRGRLEATLTRYENYSPNARFNPAPAVAIRDEVSAIFPTTFITTGADFQTTTTTGYEFEVVANPTRYWRLVANAATSEVVNEDRIPVLKSFQAEARAMNQPTPLLDEFIATLREGVPNAGYTKARANLFTRYEFSEGHLQGLYLGGGTNWRTKTFRGNVDLNQDGVAEALWSPSYYTVSLLGGYRTRIVGRPTTFAVNIDNVLDKDYYLSATNTSGSWGNPRSYRLTIITEF